MTEKLAKICHLVHETGPCDQKSLSNAAYCLPGVFMYDWSIGIERPESCHLEYDIGVCVREGFLRKESSRYELTHEGMRQVQDYGLTPEQSLRLKEIASSVKEGTDAGNLLNKFSKWREESLQAIDHMCPMDEEYLEQENDMCNEVA